MTHLWVCVKQGFHHRLARNLHTKFGMIITLMYIKQCISLIVDMFLCVRLCVCVSVCAAREYRVLFELQYFI